MPDSADGSRRRELQRRAYAPGGGLTDAEAAELQALTDRAGARRRELQRRAYAPGGGLTDAEAEELRALCTPDVVPAPVGSVNPSESPSEGPAEERADPVPNESPGVSEDPAPDPDTTDPAPDPTNPADSRPTRRWLAPLAAAVALLLGFGAGWLAFGRDDGLSMTAEQRDTWVQLEGANDYDSGSVELIGAQYGVDAWHATKQEGAHECLVLTGGERRPQANCLRADRERNPYDLQMSTSLEKDGDTISIWAMLTEDAKGDAVVIMQRQNTSEGWDWRSAYSEEELPIAEFLDASGYDGNSLQLLGYDGDLPVWLHQYDRTCLIVASATELIAEACGELDATANIDLALPGSIYSVRWTDMRGPSLTIIRDAAVTSIDDRTGEVVD
ncbi:hypothetical protein [Microbacterium alcoholitolerans]|uniref:hypothetical protein n=1 Tax=unclassified Microbacterium TaxID=2609290 RepID=UPI003D183C8A